MSSRHYAERQNFERPAESLLRERSNANISDFLRLNGTCRHIAGVGICLNISFGF